MFTFSALVYICHGDGEPLAHITIEGCFFATEIVYITYLQLIICSKYREMHWNNSGQLRNTVYKHNNLHQSYISVHGAVTWR